MADGQLHEIIRRLRRLVGARATGGLTDAQLLERFVGARDEAAFEVLLWRHGPMVLSLCRRLLHDAHAAEDAFQATFLILVRKAGSIGQHRSVGSWLYKVAYRVALAARDEAAKRTHREGPLVDVPARTSVDELRLVLDEEVRRLPEKYRAAFVLCCLEGRTREEAARELGCPEGTISSRLAWARERLRSRLTRRGVTPSDDLPALAVPAILVAATIRGMKAAASGTLATPAAVLAEGVLRTMILTRVKAGAIVLLVVGTLALGMGVAVRQSLLAQPPAAEGPPLTARDPGPKREEEKRPHTDRVGDPLPAGAVGRLGTLRWRHEGEAEAMCFSPDGKVLAALSGNDGVISFFDTATGQVLYRHPTSADLRDTDRITIPLTYTPDGKFLVYQTNDYGIHFWDTAAKKLIRSLTPAERRNVPEYKTISFSRDGKLLAANFPASLIVIWDVASGAKVSELRVNHYNPYKRFSPDGKILALGTGTSVKLWDVSNGKFLRGIDTDQPFVYPLDFSPDGKIIASGGQGCIILSDVASGKELGRLEAKMSTVLNLAFTPDGKTLVSGSEDGKVHVWDVASCQERFVRHSRGKIGRSMALTPDGKTVAMGTAYNVISLWDTVTGKELFPEQKNEHDAPIHAVVFSPDGKILVTGGENKQIRLWDAASGGLLQRLPPTASARFVSFSPDGERLATSWGDKFVRIWDVARAEELLALSHDGAQRIFGVAFAPDGKTIVSVDGKDRDDRGEVASGTGRLHVWDATAGKLLRSVTLEGLWPQCLALSPNGRLAAVGSADTLVRLCDLERGKELLSFHGHKAKTLAFSPDGRLLASGSADQSIRLWEVATGQEIMAPQSHTRSLAAIAFSPDGRVLASAEGKPGPPLWDGSKPQRIRLWDVATGRELTSFVGHNSDVTSLAFAPDGTRLVSGLKNGSVLIWDVAMKAAVPAPRNLDARALDALWADLAAEDARKAHDAIQALAMSPGQAVPYLKAHLRPAEAVDVATVSRLLADLDSDLFAAREAASRTLLRLGPLVEPSLRKELERTTSAEARRRIGQLLDKMDVPDVPELVREGRAVAALERAATDEARQLLEALAKGTPEARLTQEAKASLERLTKKTVAGP